MRLLWSYLITKESYNWWITRREWGFRHQISEAKNKKMSVANIWKHLGEFRRRVRWLWNFATWRTPFCIQRLISQPVKLAFSLVWSASNGSSSFISTPNCAPFEALDWWLPKRHIVWMKWALRSAPKVFKSFYSLEFFMLDFSLCFLSLPSWFAYGKGL